MILLIIYLISVLICAYISFTSVHKDVGYIDLGTFLVLSVISATPVANFIVAIAIYQTVHENDGTSIFRKKLF